MHNILEQVMMKALYKISKILPMKNFERSLDEAIRTYFSSNGEMG